MAQPKQGDLESVESRMASIIEGIGKVQAEYRVAQDAYNEAAKKRREVEARLSRLKDQLVKAVMETEG